MICESNEFVGVIDCLFDFGGYEFNPGVQFTAGKCESDFKWDFEYVFVVGK
jgi:hypothetical protein